MPLSIVSIFLTFISLSLLCFFFSSRRRHTRWTGDWSSDVCSSDLAPLAGGVRAPAPRDLPGTRRAGGGTRDGRGDQATAALGRAGGGGWGDCRVDSLGPATLRTLPSLR